MPKPQNAAARWSDAMRYPRELTDDAATGAADAYAAEHAAPVMPTREAFVAAAGRARLAIAALALVAGCAGPAPEPGPDGGADAGADAADGGACADQCLPPDAGDAGAGLPINAACEPTLDECAPGLTCRIASAHVGTCRPIGTLAAGAICTASDQCGAAQACLPAEAPNRLRCQVVCAIARPLERCQAGETCAPQWGADTGVCIP